MRWAIFVGGDGSCGFRYGRKYLIWIKEEKNRIWVKELFGRRCCYSSYKAIESNWDM